MMVFHGAKKSYNYVEQKYNIFLSFEITCM